MTAFRFIHTADLHLGRRFGTLPDAVRGRLVEARHQSLDRLAEAAHRHAAGHIVVAGDVFDTETPTDPVWRQALSRMGADPSLHWWLIPGNHDSLAAESLWSRFRRHAPPNVHLLDDVKPVEIAPSVFLLPAPLPRRFPGRDLTQVMAGIETGPDALRIGLAHGAVQSFSEDGGRDDAIIPPDRAATARLDYLALGDWHGHLRIAGRTWYSGTPERDGFRHGGPGVCLAVTLAAPGAPPEVSTVPTGRFTWTDHALPLVPGQDSGAALLALLDPDPAVRRDHLIQIRVTGRATLAEQAALRGAASAVEPEFCHFRLETDGLATEFETADLDRIDQAGALRLAADRLRARAEDASRDSASRRASAAALNRLYSYLKDDRG
jgi:DNA repair exonuclease SbcCD nuclease subunit